MSERVPDITPDITRDATLDVALVGASGFVGGLAGTALRERGARVRSVPAPRIHDTGEVTGVTTRHADALAELAAALDGADVVVNTAGLSDATSGDEPTLLGANGALPGIVVAAAERSRVRRVVHVSSAAVQGRRPVLDDTLDYEPFSAYSTSKMLGEVIADAEARDVELVIYRPGGVHGQGRAVTERLCRLAGSPVAAVAAPGSDPTPQALGPNVGSAIAFLALSAEPPPRVVTHPAEGCSTASLLEALSGKPPHRLPRMPVRRLVGLGHRAASRHAGAAAAVRRVEMVLLGQGQAESWLTTHGWTPVVGPEGWTDLGRAVRAAGSAR